MNTVAGCSSLQKTSAVCSVWNLVACVGNRRNSAQRRRIRLLSDAARNEWLRTGVVFGPSNFCFLSLISVPFGTKDRCGKQSSKIFSSPWVFLDWEADIRPDMFSIFTSKAKGVVELGGVKELENDEAKAEREKKEEEQRKRDEAAENLRKEEEIEAKIGPPPEKPLPGDCCGNGCTPCIWDTYWEELADYKKLRESIEKTQ